MTGIPKNEVIWVQADTGTERFLITSKADRLRYFIYKIKDDKASKLGSSENPGILEDKYIEWPEVAKE